MIVVDTNIISYLFFPSKFSELTEELIIKDPHWIAPVLWRSEFRNVLAGYIRNDLIEFEDSTAIMNRADEKNRDSVSIPLTFLKYPSFDISNILKKE